jgi:hypothetical protein
VDGAIASEVGTFAPRVAADIETEVDKLGMERYSSEWSLGLETGIQTVKLVAESVFDQMTGLSRDQQVKWERSGLEVAERMPVTEVD